MADIKDKIKKLLALATSPNEHEAKDALLKARELMAKNKLSERDFEEKKDMTLKHVTCDEVKWTTDSGNIWMVNLCKILCESYCCTCAWRTPKASRTHTLVITGIGDDADICKSVVEYAVGFVLGHIEILQRKFRSNPRAVSKSYAEGFIMGLEMALEEQKEEHKEWALVVVKPQEVTDYEKTLGNKNVRTKQASFDPLAYLRGQNDGMNFNAKRVLEA